MSLIRRAAPSLILWLVVLLGAAMLLTAPSWGPAVVRHAASLGTDDRPGERVKPDPDRMRRAQETWRKRRAE